MAKIVLDPKESGIEAFAKLFFSATRNMGLSDKEACEALRNSIEAAENAPAEEKYDCYGSPANIERILQRECCAQRTASSLQCAMVAVVQSATHGLYGRKVTTEKQP